MTVKPTETLTSKQSK